MTQPKAKALTRRRFLRTVAAASAGAVVPAFIPAGAIGRDGAVATSEKILLGGIGIRGRGTRVLQTMLPQPDVRFVAIADVRADRRKAVKQMADQQNGDDACATYRDFRDFRELLDRDDVTDPHAEEVYWIPHGGAA